MIDGIRLAPHVYAIRRESRVDGSGAQERYLDCAQCMETLGEAERASLRCGWLPAHRLPGPDPEPDPEKRAPHPMLPPTAPRIVSQDCPGWLFALPEVGEAMHARLWWDKGQLADYVRDRPKSAWLEHYVDTATGAIAELELERETERERHRKRAEADRR